MNVDWPSITGALDEDGIAAIRCLLTTSECESLACLYDDDSAFRAHIHMRQHGFGQGEYKYLSYPLPEIIARIRQDMYPKLVPLANQWMIRMGTSVRYPNTHQEFLARCHAAGQARPTPLILRYDPGDYNCLHQDLYGEHVFPIQLAILLNEPDVDFEGGELVITEQRPRMQSRAEVVPLRRGDGVLFAVDERPKRGKRRDYRVRMRHGVSRVRSGRRHTLGVIFHDAA